MNAQLRDLGSTVLIGNGIAGLIAPRQHCLNWEIGPRPYRRLIHKFVKHPQVTRILGAVEAGLGVWLLARPRWRFRR